MLFRGLSLFAWRHALPHSLAACRSRTSTTAVAILETSKVNSMIKRLKLSDDPRHCEVSGACRARTCTGQIEKNRSRLKDFRPNPPPPPTSRAAQARILTCTGVVRRPGTHDEVISHRCLSQGSVRSERSGPVRGPLRGRIPVLPLPLARRFHIIDTVCMCRGIKNKGSRLTQLSPDENHPGNAGP